MKKIKLKWVIIFIVVVGIIIFLLTRIKEKPFNQIELDKQNVITNNTEVAYYDTILHVGLNELNIDSTYLIVKDFAGGAMGEFDLKAYILGNDFQYMVYMKKSSRSSAIEFLSHELIHLKQFNDDRLIKVDNIHMVWEGETLDAMAIPYKLRPWEKEAFEKSRELENKIRKKLYE